MYICTQYVNVQHDAHADVLNVRIGIIKQIAPTAV